MFIRVIKCRGRCVVSSRWCDGISRRVPSEIWRECCVDRLTARSLAAARAWARHGRRRRSATSGQAVSIASPTSRYLTLPRNPLSLGRFRTWWIILVIASSFDVAKPCAIVFHFSAEPTFSRSCSVTASATLRHFERSDRP